MSLEGPEAQGAAPSGPTYPEVGAWGASAEFSRADTVDAADAARGLRETCHDMRQPVASVLALAGAALSEPGLPRTVRVSLEQIVQQAERLADMIQDWLHGAQRGDASSPG